MPTADPIDPAPDMAAAEFALCLLEGEERNVALRRLVAEPGFAAEVERWQVWLSELFAHWPAVAAPEGVAERIEASLDARGASPAANDNQMLWRSLAIGASIAACLLLAVTTLLLMRPAP